VERLIARPRLAFATGFVALLVALIVAVGVAVHAQYTAADRAYHRNRTAEQLLTAMVDQETGLRGYILNRTDEFLEPYTTGRANLVATAAEARQLTADGTPAQRVALEDQIAAAEDWHTLADRTLRNAQEFGARPSRTDAIQRKELVDRFRAANRTFAQLFEQARHDSQRRAALVSVAAVAVVCLFFGIAGFALERGSRRRALRLRMSAEAYRSTQDRFRELLNVSEDQGEARELLKQHLERTVPDAAVAVLVRNDAEQRLEAGTPLAPASPLTGRMEHATPRSCLAVRLGRTHDETEDATPPLNCALCASPSGRTRCTPLLASGKGIGAVVIRTARAISDADGRRINDSVAQAGPVLANLRTLALAEQRAMTDVLTGLPNRRALQDAARQMVAQAGRSRAALAAVMVDLDHFKSINDTFGHDRGDEVLAAVGLLLRDAVRTSDLPARLGGEEFVVMLPDTDVMGAAHAAEALRSKVARLRVPGIGGHRLTASFGIAAIPKQAADVDGLLAAADRALYRAKQLGRDRVEIAVDEPDRGTTGPLAGRLAAPHA
jgi:diguanylate cyclase (GGDEF)-like protein